MTGKQATVVASSVPANAAGSSAHSGKLPLPIRHAGAWDRYELPTILLALVLYGVWGSLVWWHASVPGPLLFLLGGYVAQLHFSLQHESIHAMRGLPAWLRLALVGLPINLWLPYPFYHGGHSTHHVNFNLTHPVKDTESYYHNQGGWRAFHPLSRWLYGINQTVVFRVVFGPLLRIVRLVRTEASFVRKGDFRRLKVWLLHALSAVPVLIFVTQLADMRWWEYILYFVYPGMMLGALRTFTEHRWGESPQQRTAIVESNWVGGLLYLYNNLHQVHHRFPTLPWYHIPGYFRRHRREVLDSNGHFYYRGYGEIVRRFWRRPVFDPVHPRW